MAKDIECAVCSSVFRVAGNRENTAKYCSRLCSAEGSRKPVNSRCRECGSEFRRKPSKVSKSKIGFFCNTDCFALFKKKNNSGENNPNYKGRNVDSDGYRFNVPHASGFLNSEKKLHRAIVADVLGVDKLPSNVHVHHRDCDQSNNVMGNLVMLTPSDHKWLHQQFGNATLWAFMNNKVGISDLADWSDDPIRAKRILFLDCLSQSLSWKNATDKKEEAALMAHYEVVKDVNFVRIYDA